MKKATLILLLLSVVAFTSYTLTNLAFDYRPIDASVDYQVSMERRALLESEKIKEFEVSELASIFSNVNGRHIRARFTVEGTHPLFNDITIEDVREGNATNRIRLELIESWRGTITDRSVTHEPDDEPEYYDFRGKLF